MRYRRTLLVVALWVLLVGLCALSWGQSSADGGGVVISERTLIPISTVIVLIGLAGAAWAIKSDVRSVREALSAHSADHDAHHTAGDLQSQFVMRREHDTCFGTVQRDLARILAKLDGKE